MSEELDQKIILLVDDDEINSKILAKRLEKRDFKVVIKHSGKDCLEYLQSINVDLILLDIMMPDMSGQDVLSKIRETKTTIELPIIMVTAKNETEDLVDALKNGANDYIQKPVNVDVAVARINTQLTATSFYKESLEKAELETLHAMIVTYNHEINNPLTIAFGAIRKLKKSFSLQDVEKLEQSLMRVTDIVKRIDNINEQRQLEKAEYAKGHSMIKLK